MKNNATFTKEDIIEIKDKIKQLEKIAIEDEGKRSTILATLENLRDRIELESFNSKTPLEEIKFNRLYSTIQRSIRKIERAEKGIKNINMSWLQSKAFKRTGIALTGLAGLGLVAVLATSCGKKPKETETVNTITVERLDGDNALNTVKSNVEEVTKEEEQLQKEEAIINLVKELTAKFNEFEGLNVTEEQVLSLFIHLNVGNSYMNDNALALDKLTREDLVKKYYVGLEPNSEEFEEYKVSDDDLAKLTSNVMELRNELNNYIIVLNDQGKYEESKKILNILNGFITEESLQDEASVLIESVQNIQTNDKKEIKKTSIFMVQLSICWSKIRS